VNRRSAPWAKAFAATAPTKSIIQASTCRQLSLNKSVALHAINKKILDSYILFLHWHAYRQLATYALSCLCIPVSNAVAE